MSSWQPIETAPKDGTDFLATDGKTVVYCIWSGTICAFDWKDASQPTHWMPLPAPPTEGRMYE